MKEKACIIKKHLYSAFQVCFIALLYFFSRIWCKSYCKQSVAAGYLCGISRSIQTFRKKDFHTMNNFNDLGLPEQILGTLNKINFTCPTPIQEKAIPAALAGHDILGSAQTGTGKTAAFAIPMICHLMKNESSSALILLPTRELAQQVEEAANKMTGSNSNIKTVLLIGGEPIGKQLQQLRRNPRIIVGTPGRVNDHLQRGSLDLGFADFLVLDETDRMLDMGFGIQLDQIMKFVPKQRQTLMFSATLPKEIIRLSQKYLKHPQRIAIGSTTQVAANIRQEIIKTDDAKKYGDLMQQLQTREGAILIFVKTKYSADRLAKKLTNENQPALSIHGDLPQRRRERVISDFKNRKNRILVATDIAARGLDIAHIEHVVNYDLPQCPEDYIHRIGRTARAGASGCAVNLLTARDGKQWKEIYKLINPANQNNSDELSFEASQETRTPRTKAKTSKANPFKPFAPDKKTKARSKFNKNARSFADRLAEPIKMTQPRRNFRNKKAA